MCTVQNTLTDINLLVGTAKDFIEIIVAIIGGICAVKGISYLQTLKEKRTSAIFTFWSQLSVHVFALYSILNENPSVINGLYSASVRIPWSSSETEVSFSVIERFYHDAQKTLLFIETTADQMPAYSEWTKDYQKFIEFLIIVTRYDITDFEHNFFFKGHGSIEERNKYCEEACTAMKQLLDGMKSEQEKASKKIHKRTRKSKQKKRQSS